MNTADRKTLGEIHSDLTSQIEDLQAILGRFDFDAEKERTAIVHAIDGMSDARFYVKHAIELTRGFYPAEAV